MSADNIIFCIKIEDKYWVWHSYASNNNPKPNEKTDMSFWTEEAALEFARELEDEYEYVEYGICTDITSLKEQKKSEQENIRNISENFE